MKYGLFFLVFFLLIISISVNGLNTISETKQGMPILKQIGVDLFYPCFANLNTIECEPIDQIKINEWILWANANTEPKDKGKVISDLVKGITPFKKIEHKFNEITNESYIEETIEEIDLLKGFSKTIDLTNVPPNTEYKIGFSTN